ncbi:hypothetical protein [Neorhizobium sp. NCHU2750]|uniref:hypothetical protein n=1 Tax=Neorhizobium sp. NCHU2750 TaxID=1825976 RepID=UPI000EB63D61|nr:hypothetical protein NCHU2750_11590 [Neorhizobium sp. NCHU2750]
MNKLQCLAFIFASAFISPAYAATSTEVASQTLSVSSPTLRPVTNSSASIIFLDTGTYSIDLLVTQTLTGLSGGYSYLWEISRATNAYLGTVANLRDPLLPGQPSTLNSTFTVEDGAAVKYAWFYSVGAANTTATMTTTISKITAVPGPEAGTGAGALALGGGFLILRHRRRNQAIPG